MSLKSPPAIKKYLVRPFQNMRMLQEGQYDATGRSRGGKFANNINF